MFSFFRKFQSFIVAFFLVGLALSVYSSNLQATDTPSLFKRTVLSLYSPPLRALSSLSRGVMRLWESYIFLLHTQKKNITLQKSLDMLTEQNTQTKELLLENDRLRKMLSLKKRSSSRLVSAEIIGKDPMGWFKTALINKGRNDAISRSQAVVAHQGVVGRITDVAAHTSKVLLITDINSSVDALAQRTRARGIVEGRASGLCDLNYVSSSDDVRPGDLVVTSGLCGLFPKGLPIGKVSRVEKDNVGIFQSVEVVPCVDLNKLEEISILFPRGD